MVMHKLQDYLVKKHSEGGTVVVFIEEAQGMPIETLEEIRLLSNLETHRHKLMQIILFGQPELDKNLQGKNIRQLRERITHSFYLEPMNHEQTSDYLHFRLQVAGCPWPQVFTSKAEKLINKASEGLTRRINILADKSLMAAYASSTIQPGHQFGAIQQKVLPQHVKAAIKDSGYGMRHLLPWTAFFSGFGILVLVIALYFGINAFQSEQEFRPVQVISELAENIPQATETAVELEADLTLEESETQNSVEEALSIPQEEVVVSAVIEERVGQQLNEANVEPSFDEPESASSGIVQAGLQAAETEITLTAEPQTDEIIEPIQVVESDEILVSAGQTQVIETSEPRAPRTEAVEIDAPVLAEIQNQPFESAPRNITMGTEGFSELSGLIGVRARASTEWLQNIANKNSYTVQMAAFPISDQPLLEEYLQLLSLTELLDETYLCLISRTANRPQQWLVIHGDFNGVSRARDYIESLPTYSRQYEPFARNSNSIACLSDMSEGALLAF